MPRSHEFLALKQAENRLAEAVSEVDRIRSSRDFVLDEQFFKGLHHLMDAYGFNAADVVRLLVARDPDINFPEHENSTMMYLEKVIEFVILDERELNEPDQREISYGNGTSEEFRTHVDVEKNGVCET